MDFTVNGQTLDTLKIEVQMTDYQKAIKLADDLFVELNLTRSDYNLVELKNLLLFGGEGSYELTMWKITYKGKPKDGGNEYMYKGGFLFIEVNIETQKAKFLGFGE